MLTIQVRIRRWWVSLLLHPRSLSWLLVITRALLSASYVLGQLLSHMCQAWRHRHRRMSVLTQTARFCSICHAVEQLTIRQLPVLLLNLIHPLLFWRKLVLGTDTGFSSNKQSHLVTQKLSPRTQLGERTYYKPLLTSSLLYPRRWSASSKLLPSSSGQFTLIEHSQTCHLPTLKPF